VIRPYLFAIVCGEYVENNFMPPLVTIERHILDQQRQHPSATGVFSDILYDIALAAKMIARETTRAGLVNILGTAGGINASGDSQAKLDVFADQTIFRMNDHTGRLCVMASEEHEDILPIPDRFPCGKYVLVFDPLDGSSNIDVNASLGTIFGIYRKVSEGSRGSVQDVLQPGTALAGAGYIIYAPSTMLVYTTGQGVHGFTLDPSVGEFILSHPDIRIPSPPKYYSVNQGNQKFWTPGTAKFIQWLQGLDDDNRKPLDTRYIGTLVADFHRILLKGGVFCYPADTRDVKKVGGKLRLVYECAPLAWLAEQAGGYASDGVGNVREIVPHELHQRAPLFIGDAELVRRAESFIQQYDQDWIARYMPYRSS
jgi:fructose-1,6-bisphosphatase I